MIRIFFLLSSVFVVVSGLLAEAPEVTIHRSYARRGDFGAILPADTLPLPRTFYLSGSSFEGQFQFYVLKIDSIGDTLWSRTAGQADQASGYAIGRGQSVLIGGSTLDEGAGDYRLRTVSAAGDFANLNLFGQDDRVERITAVLVRAGGQMAVAGDAELDNDLIDATLFGLDSLGSVQWERTFTDGRGVTNVWAIGDSLRLIGTADAVGNRGLDFWILQTDTAGNRGTARRYGSGVDEVATDAIRRSSGFTTIVGSRTETSGSDVWILLLNAAQDSFRTFYWRTAGDDIPTCIVDAGDPDSGFVIGGYVLTDSTTRGFIARFAGNGDSLWTIFVDEQRGVRIADIYRDANFHYHAAGSLITQTGQRGYYLETATDPESPGQHPPGAFDLLLPTERDTVFADSVFFDWEDAIDPNGDAVHYTLLVDSDSLFQPPYRTFGPVFVSRYTWRSDTDDVNLYWRIIAADPFNNNRLCTESQRSFWRFLPDPTQAFHLLEPDSDYALGQEAQRFTWSRAIDVDLNDSVRYDLTFETPDTATTVIGLRDTFLTVFFNDTLLFPRASQVFWYVTARSSFNPMVQTSSETWSFTTWSLDSDVPPVLPAEFGIAAIYPNPFNSRAQIRFGIEHEGPVQLEIFDITGRRVMVLLDEQLAAGTHVRTWDANHAAAGIYFARLRTGDEMATQKLLLLK